MAHTLKVLLWKMYILRRRRWVIALLELLLPISMFFILVAYSSSFSSDSSNNIQYDDSPIQYKGYVYNETYYIAYTPSNNFTDTIMAEVNKTLKNSAVKVTMVHKTNEENVLNWLREEYLIEQLNSLLSVFSNYPQPAGVGVIFVDSNDTDNLQYTLRTTTGSLKTTDSTLSGQQIGSSSTYDLSGFITVQSAIDQAYLTTYQNVVISDNVYIEFLPNVQFVTFQTFSSLLPYVITIGFNFVMPSLLKGIVEEKSSGIKEMMKIVGLKPWINWVNWVMYGMFVYIPVTLMVSIILTSDSGSGPSIDCSFVVIWNILLLSTFSFVILTFAISTFFTNGSVAVGVGLTMWYAISLFVSTTFVSNPDGYALSTHLVTCLWPVVALMWAINTIITFQSNNNPWTLNDLFDDGANGNRVSVGLATIMLCVDVLIYSLITWYIDSVKPGPYGRAKPLSFIFRCFCCKKKEYYDSSKSITSKLHENYENPPINAKIGIKIKNLQKTFNNGKVEAVKNVDLDIYEGNITALLGHNGAGKTTTMSLLSGFYSPTKGKVIVRGKNIFDNMDDFRSSLGICPQHNILFSFFTVYDHLMFFGMLKGLSKKQARVEGMELLKTLKLDGKKNEMASKLSGGMKRKLCLCIALLGNPQILMLDEPTSGLDPESRRHVWDILLTFRGQRTTIITTHFMEEADVLGDRIAIMDHGLVSCYGTTMFLKKLYGSGYNLNLTKTEDASVGDITSVVETYVSNVITKMSSPTQLTYNIKSDESSKFPDLFSALDSKKNDLGVKGIALTCTTMEDVFLKVAEQPEDTNADSNGNEEDEIFCSKHKKITGCGLIFLQTKALIFQYFLTRIRNLILTFCLAIIPVLLMANAVYESIEYDASSNQPSLLISLCSFSNVHVAVSSSNAYFSAVTLNIIDAGGASFDAIPSGTSFNDYFAQQITSNLKRYEKQVIAGFKTNSTYLLGGYSSYLVHSYPLVLNMIANILLQLDNPNSTSTITVYNHPIIFKSVEDVCDLYKLADVHIIMFPFIMMFLSLGLVMLAMAFIMFPLYERVVKAKQLQLMTGVSPFLYWTVLLVCDFIIYIIIAAVMLAMVFVFQTNQIYTSSGSMDLLILVFIMFGFSGIVYAYFFSFLSRSPVRAAVCFVLFNLITGLVAAAIFAVMGRLTSKYDTWRYVFSFNPIYTATTAFTYLFSAMYIDGLCFQCARNYCNPQDPLQFLEAGPTSISPFGINNCLIYFVVDFVLYFGLIMLTEYGAFKKIWFLITKIKMSNECLEDDLDVLAEKKKVHSSLSVQADISKVSILRVKDLGKMYKWNMTAVQSLTFQVDEGECFGLLGVNGAGKSTTFKVLTGEEIPNKGDATILLRSLVKQKSKFLAQVGYCPQFDAINTALTGKEMLLVYALLRGVPSDHCEAEVLKWITIMGLTEFGDRRCGTYSGGNKRKLSTAMAFIGEPPVVFLDEPTSGVDPVSRRKLWDVVTKCQRAGQAIVLTSHSMEECEALCSRLTIMVAGHMKCVGTPQHLKQKFGIGFTIKIKLSSTDDLQNVLDKLKNDMSNFFRRCSIEDEHVGLLHYYIPDPTIKLSELFTKMEQLKSSHDIIEDYIVNDTTLEQVFMSIAREVTPT